MTAAAGRSLQVGDVAGVAWGLQQAMADHSSWSVSNVDLPEFAAGAHPVLRAACWPPRAVMSGFTVRQRTRSAQPDVVHLHWARYTPFIRTGSTPLLVHAHGSDVRGRRDSAFGRIVTRSLGRAALVLAATPDLLTDLPPGAIHFPNPVDTDLFRPISATDLQERRRVLIFARLTDVKGADVIIDAVRQIRRACPDVAIAGIAGGSHDQIARSAGIELIGPLGRSGLVDELRSASVVIGQQRIGSLGLSELEAMACALPVVARVELAQYDERPPVCSVDGVDELASTCLRLLDAPDERKALGGSARSYVDRMHSHRSVAVRLEAIYDQLRNTG